MTESQHAESVMPCIHRLHRRASSAFGLLLGSHAGGVHGDDGATQAGMSTRGCTRNFDGGSALLHVDGGWWWLRNVLGTSKESPPFARPVCPEVTGLHGAGCEERDQDMVATCYFLFFIAVPLFLVQENSARRCAEPGSDMQC